MCACACKCLHMQGHACRDAWTCMRAAYTVTSKRPPPQGGGVCMCMPMIAYAVTCMPPPMDMHNSGIYCHLQAPTPTGVGGAP